MAAEKKELHIIHFNDVYNIEQRDQEPVGGASRFVTAVNQLKHLNPLILFSGDIFSPSSMGAVTKGQQMVDVMNHIGIHFSLFGNHDFDYGMDRLDELKEQTKCQWLMSNALDATTNLPLAGGEVSLIVQWGGFKVGLMGLIERDWVDCLGSVNAEDVEVMDPVEEGRSIAEELKTQGADVIIALTHMRWPNDIRLASMVPQIDLVLGGHDHDFTYKELDGGGRVLKSGCDFREFAHVVVSFEDGGGMRGVSVQRVEVNSQVPEDLQVKVLVDHFMGEMQSKLDEVIGCMEVSLDGLFSTVRRSESNLGNFVTDIMLNSTNADVAILNSGTLRSDTLHEKGDFRMKDLLSMLPMVDPLVLLNMTGKQLVEALENSVSKYPALEGRFAQVSGVCFGFDPRQEPGNRIKPEHVKVQGDPIDLEQYYKVVTKAYLADGRDGYDVFAQAEVLMNAEDGPSLVTVVRNHFESVKVLRGEVKAKSAHRQSLISLKRRMTVAFEADQSFRLLHQTISNILENSDCDVTDDFENTISSPLNSTESFVTSPKMKKEHAVKRRQSLMNRSRHCLERHDSVNMAETSQLPHALAPCTEGRIWLVREDMRTMLPSRISEADEDKSF